MRCVPLLLRTGTRLGEPGGCRVSLLRAAVRMLLRSDCAAAYCEARCGYGRAGVRPGRHAAAHCERGNGRRVHADALGAITPRAHIGCCGAVAVIYDLLMFVFLFITLPSIDTIAPVFATNQSETQSYIYFLGTS